MSIFGRPSSTVWKLLTSDVSSHWPAVMVVAAGAASSASASPPPQAVTSKSGNMQAIARIVHPLPLDMGRDRNGARRAWP